MQEIITLFGCFDHCLGATTQRQFSHIVPALLALTGRVTMRGLARWGGPGTSYRTVQRFYNTVLPWGQLSWLFFRQHLFCPQEVYLLVGDESVVTKAGHKTYGLDRFFSSIYNKPVRGLSFFTLSLVGVQEGLSHPLLVEQVVPPKATPVPEPPAPATAAGGTPRKRGRPSGSPNQDKTQITWTAELHRLERMGRTLLSFINSLFGVTYLVLDGHFGNNNVLQVVRQRLGLHLISKLRHDSALYFEYDGPQQPSGPRRRYGDKIHYAALPLAHRVAVTQDKDKGVRTEVYQATMLHQSFATRLNVVILVKTNLKSGSRAHAVLFSSDLELGWEELVRYYRLRFQIEFNFRDAKQFWGLEDFMNVGQTPVTNAANLAFFMVNLSHCLLHRWRQAPAQPAPAQPVAAPASQVGVLDLKAYWRGRHYAQATLELLPQPPAPILMEQIIQHVATQGAIHAQPSPFSFP